MRFLSIVAIYTLLTATALAQESGNWLSRGWSISGFAGPWTNTESSDIFLEQEWRTDSWIIGLAGGKELFRWNNQLALEAEVHVVRHVAGESSWAVAGLAVARWLDFPWNDTVDTTFAAGFGPSYSTGEPTDVEVEDAAQLVAGLFLELTLGPPDAGWSGVIRYQHRSSAFGLFGDGAQDEGTGPVFGMKYRF